MAASADGFRNPFNLVSLILYLVGMILILFGSIAIGVSSLSLFLLFLDLVLLIAFIYLLATGSFDSYKNVFIYFFIILSVFYLGSCGLVSNGGGSSAIGFGAILRVILNFIFFIVYGSEGNTPFGSFASRG